MRVNPEAKKAIMLGGMCSTSYFAVYIARNILGAVSPQIIESGLYTTENIGALSSAYFIMYAFGQLINGRVGDKVKAKYMVSLGLVLAGISNLLFSLGSGSYTIVYISYAMTGYFLSMIYAPITKVVAENTKPIYATRCSLGYTFASFFGNPIAGVLAAVLMWNVVFSVSSIILISMGVVCYIVFSIYEKKGYIKYNQYAQPKLNGNGLRMLIQHQIIKFTLISILTGIIRTTVVFWLPTYLSQHIGFQSDTSALIYTAVTLAISASPFIAVFIYEMNGRNMNKTLLIAFACSALFFLGVWLVRQSALNIICLALAIISSNCAASMLWSRYCPSLRDTGMVSSATGFLDFISYMSASVSSNIFANAVSSIGWSNLILVWFGLMVVGVIVSLSGKRNI